MRPLSQQLISAEHRRDDPSDTESRAVFRVCDKLRASLCPLVGTHGYRTFLLRALTLSRGEADWIGRLDVDAQGSLILTTELEENLGEAALVSGGRVLITQLLELLVTFIGEALTQRLVQQIWPTTAPGPSNSGGKT